MLTTHKATVLTGLIVSGALLLMALAGCGGGNGEPTGLLQVGLTDAATEGLASVWVSIHEVQVVPAELVGQNDGPFPVVASFDPSLAINIMDLAYQQQLLGEGQVPIGQYGQVRLVLDPNPDTGNPLDLLNYVTYIGDGTRIPLKTPSGQQSGLKVLGQFEVVAGEMNAIVLDFDPAKAIVVAGQSGQTLLKPTGIRITQVEEILGSYGAIAGTVMPELAWPTAVVLVVPTGETAPVARGSVNPGPEDGGSFRACVPAGDYFLVVTAEHYEMHTSSDYTIPIGEPDIDAGVIVLEEAYGCIIGTVTPPEAWPTALVSVVRVSDDATVAAGSVDPGDGSFQVCVPAGDYYLVVTADGYQTHTSSPYAVVSESDTTAAVIDLSPVE